MRKFILLFTLTLTFSSPAKSLYKARIQYLDGKTAEGYASLPSNDLFSGNVNFSASEDGKATKLEDDEIQSIIYTTDRGNQYYFEHTNYRHLSGKTYDKNSEKRFWMLVTFAHDLIMTYSHAQSYYIDKEEKIVSKSVDRSGTWADIFILFKRPGEALPTRITSITYGAQVMNQQKTFRKIAARYFKDDTAFAERIENKEFKHDEIGKLVNAYIAYKTQ
jgi:hypothetical protein